VNVVFISQCHKRAFKRTCQVLDAYAYRRGDRSWMTRITAEGLATVRAQLRAVASKATAVACFVDRGTAGLKLEWIVGSRSGFSPEGQTACAESQSARHTRFLRQEILEEGVQTGSIEPRRTELPLGLRVACCLAAASGYRHDLGKFGAMFQKKLRLKPTASPLEKADPVRHEWLSLHLMVRTAATGLGPGWKQAWQEASQEQTLLKMAEVQNAPDFVAGLRSAEAAMQFLVATHHKLPRETSSRSFHLDERTYRHKHNKPLPSGPDAAPVCAPAPSTLKILDSSAKRLAKLEASLPPQLRSDPLFWRACATLARMALILADHRVSSIDVTSSKALQRATEGYPRKAMANTVKKQGKSLLNQPLDWHLQNVGKEASRYLPHLLSYAPPGLSSPVVQRLAAPSEGRFKWQSDAYAALSSAQREVRLPSLVLNVAGTGSGKTRGNVKLIAGLREGEEVRIATCLNLRSLTLQTRDAYASQLGMDKADLACVIGSRLAVKMHAARTAGGQAEEEPASWEDEDGNEPEDEFSVFGESDPVPAVLEKFVADKPHMASVISAPVLVCTADFLVHAGDPTKKVTHALAMLRLIRSDLILDEVDSYDPRSLAAILRLVTAAAMWGRHVIASSATLSRPVAEGLFQAYELGIRLGQAVGILPSTRFRQVLVADTHPAQLATCDSRESFGHWFTGGMKAILQPAGRRTFRPAELIRVPASDDKSGILATIEDACARMHFRHRAPVAEDGHTISFGLVRIANINTAVEVARHLDGSKQLRALGVRIACYHSQLPTISRFVLERTLDSVLTRHPGSPGLMEWPEVRDCVEASRKRGLNTTCFIVVATPVEEIGRDHDFDWCVIEPSSTQSIVQTAGRVNRHRLVPVEQPNVGILQYNFRHVSSRGKGPCFVRPGLEFLGDAGSTHPSHDLAELLDWQALAQCGQVDARLRFDTQVHAFSAADDAATAAQLHVHFRRFLASDQPLWMGADTYTEAPLRDNSQPTELWTQDEDGTLYRYEAGEPVRRYARVEDPLATDWLPSTPELLLLEAERIGISCAEAFQASVRTPPAAGTVSFSPSLGYYSG